MIKKVEGQINYSYNDHVMDNFRLRTPPTMTMTMHGMQIAVPNKMEMEVTRRTLNARAAMTSEWDKVSLMTGIDSQRNKHGGNMIMYAMPSMNSPFKTNMEFESYGAFGELSYAFNERKD